MEFGIPLRLAGVMNLTLLLLRPFNIQRRESYLRYFVEKTKTKSNKTTRTPTATKHFNAGLFSDIYRPISFKLGMAIETTKFYILLSDWIILIFIKVTVA